MNYNDHTQCEVLRKIYETKMDQIAEMDLSEQQLKYQVLKAEAEAIKAQLDLSEC